MINCDDIIGEKIVEYNPNLLKISNYSCKKLISRGSESSKTNVLLNFINHQPDTNKIYQHAKDPYKSKINFLIDKRENLGLRNCNHSKTFIKYLSDMDDIYENIDEFNPNEKNNDWLYTN